jgi:hypothetical protein
MTLIQRRDAISKLAVGVLGTVWAFISCTPLNRTSRRTQTANLLPAELASRLEKDLVLLGKRKYSEQGIPTFLVCENLAPGERLDGDAPLGEGAALAEDFRQHTDLMFRMRPEVTKEDVARLVEVLADRDFGILTTGRNGRP